MVLKKSQKIYKEGIFLVTFNFDNHIVTQEELKLNQLLVSPYVGYYQYLNSKIETKGFVMYAVEFQATIENGIVHIPKKYEDLQEKREVGFSVYFFSLIWK